MDDKNADRLSETNGTLKVAGHTHAPQVIGHRSDTLSQRSRAAFEIVTGTAFESTQAVRLTKAALTF